MILSKVLFFIGMTQAILCIVLGFAVRNTMTPGKFKFICGHLAIGVSVAILGANSLMWW